MFLMNRLGLSDGRWRSEVAQSAVAEGRNPRRHREKEPRRRDTSRGAIREEIQKGISSNPVIVQLFIILVHSLVILNRSCIIVHPRHPFPPSLPPSSIMHLSWLKPRLPVASPRSNLRGAPRLRRLNLRHVELGPSKVCKNKRGLPSSGRTQ